MQPMQMTLSFAICPFRGGGASPPEAGRQATAEEIQQTLRGPATAVLVSRLRAGEEQRETERVTSRSTEDVTTILGLVHRNLLS